MKIAFVQELFYEWQAPMQLSALAKERGHECSMIIDKVPENAAKKVLQYRADLVIFSMVITGSHFYVLETSKKIKKQASVPIVIGGPHPSLCTHMLENPSIDFLCQGEGEITFIMLLDKILRGGSLEGIPGLWYKDGRQNIISNRPAPLIQLDDLPFLDRDLYYRYKVFRYEKARYVYFSRGCKYDCTYCCVPVMRRVNGEGPQLRYRSPELVCAEINQMNKKYGINYVSFQEDTFVQDRDWAVEFLNRYSREVKIPFMCMLTAEDVDEKIVKGLKKGGCVSALLTVDTGDETIRRELLGRNTSNEDYLRAVMLLKKYNVSISTINLLGLPGENLKKAKETIAFNRKLNVDFPWAMLYRPYPNTELEKRIVEMGLLDMEKSRSSKEKNLYCSSLLLQPEIEKLVNLQKLFSYAVKYPWVSRDFFLQQKWAFKIYYHLFCLYSYYREVKFWKRSGLITFYSGMKNYSK